MSQSSLSLFDLVPGKVLLDRYRIVRPHRESGMSAIFAVKDLETSTRYELQVFTGGLFEDREQAEGFANTLRAWNNVDSPAVQGQVEVAVLDDGAVLLVSEFPPGRSLRGWMAEHPRMPADDVVDLALKLLGGLASAHELGLVHGDIKPATVFLDPDDRTALIMDGGVTPGLWAAKHLGTRTALIGTPYYAPLEQFSGDSPDESSDLYNLGTVIYELLTGVLPWQGKGYIEVFQSKLQSGPPPMAQRAPGVDVPAELEAAVAKSLRAKRGERFGSAKAFLAALETAMA